MRSINANVGIDEVTMLLSSGAGGGAGVVPGDDFGFVSACRVRK